MSVCCLQSYNDMIAITNRSKKTKGNKKINKKIKCKKWRNMYNYRMSPENLSHRCPLPPTLLSTTNFSHFLKIHTTATRNIHKRESKLLCAYTDNV